MKCIEMAWCGLSVCKQRHEGHDSRNGRGPQLFVSRGCLTQLPCLCFSLPSINKYGHIAIQKNKNTNTILEPKYRALLYFGFSSHPNRCPTIVSLYHRTNDSDHINSSHGFIGLGFAGSMDPPNVRHGSHVASIDPFNVGHA